MLGNLGDSLFGIRVVPSSWLPETIQQKRFRFVPFVPCELVIAEYEVNISPMIMTDGQTVVVSQVVYDALKET